MMNKLKYIEIFLYFYVFQSVTYYWNWIILKFAEPLISKFCIKILFFAEKPNDFYADKLLKKPDGIQFSVRTDQIICCRV